LDLSDNYTGKRKLFRCKCTEVFTYQYQTHTHRDQDGIQCVGISPAITVLDGCWRTNMSTQL